MQYPTPSPHRHAAYTAHQTPATTPVAFLALGQIIALIEKRLRWYGFSDWRINDVLCNHDQTVSVKIGSRDGIVLTMSFARDCAAVQYGIHMPQALQRALQPGARQPIQPAKLARRPAVFGRPPEPLRPSGGIAQTGGGRRGRTHPVQQAMAHASRTVD
jgi:hypothetical protein